MPRIYPVYIVDDHDHVRAFLALLCEERGLPHRSFASGEDFLEAIEGLAPGCVILDIRMPRVSGMQVQNAMVESGHNWPIIAISGHGDVDMAVEMMRAGAVDFLEKPLTEDLLFDAVDRAFARLDG